MIIIENIIRTLWDVTVEFIKDSRCCRAEIMICFTVGLPCREWQDHARSGQADQGRLLATELVHSIRSLLSLLQDGWDAEQHRDLLQPCKTGRGAHRSVRQQDHLGDHQGQPRRSDTPTDKNEVQGTCVHVKSCSLAHKAPQSFRCTFQRAAIKSFESGPGIRLSKMYIELYTRPRPHFSRLGTLGWLAAVPFAWVTYMYIFLTIETSRWQRAVASQNNEGFIPGFGSRERGANVQGPKVPPCPPPPHFTPPNKLHWGWSH